MIIKTNLESVKSSSINIFTMSTGHRISSAIRMTVLMKLMQSKSKQTKNFRPKSSVVSMTNS